MKILVCALLLINLVSFSQGRDSLASSGKVDVNKGKCVTERAKDTLFGIECVTIHPQYPGGHPAFVAYIQKNLDYNEKAKKLKIEGKVFIEFVIDKNGQVGEVILKKGINAIAKKKKLQADYDAAARMLEEGAMNVIKNMPRWSPGYQNDKPVKVRYILPVNYNLK